MKIKSIYISSLEAGTGNLSVSIGLMRLFKQNFHKVAFFRPVIQTVTDNDINFMLEHFGLKQKKKDSFGFLVEDVQNMLATNKSHELYEKLIEKVKFLEQNYDFVLIQGLSKEALSSTIDFDINLTFAKHFNSPFISILNAKDKTNDKIYEEMQLEAKSISKEGCSHFATIVNKIQNKNYQQLKSLVPKCSYLTFFIPLVEELEKLTMLDIKSNLNCELFFGNTKNLNQKISDIKIASMTLENYLKWVEKENLIIVSGDRSDIILGSLNAIHSQNMPHISGLILTGGLKPDASIMKLLEGFKDIGICLLSVDTDTYQTSLDMQNIKPQLTHKSYTKIALILGTFSKYIDDNLLTKAFNLTTSDIMTPIMFEFNLFQRAKKDKKHIVLNESNDDRILRACEILLYQDVVDITLIGNSGDILHKANILGIDLTKANIIDPLTSPLTDKFANEFYNLRKSKGILLENAQDIMLTNSTYFATMMVYLNYADGLVSGAVGTTADTVRPALQIIKTKSNIDIVSSVFFMCFDTKVLVYGDCAINPSPKAKELSQIAISSAHTAKQFGIEPKVAMLSYSTGVSGIGEDVELVADATAQAKKLDKSIIVEGPIQYDTAIDKQTALKKSPNSKLQGDASVLIFPDLNTGNNTYKAVQKSSGAVAIGPVLQGLNKPINDLSRGCKVVDIVNTVAITAIQAGLVIKD
ncbi:MAG: phosphate acetyltransferase [Arcobacteraceae bacterium]|nr:phosphate acetyltransferase [Arcobacteraceae bacterium]